MKQTTLLPKETLHYQKVVALIRKFAQTRKPKEVLADIRSGKPFRITGGEIRYILGTYENEPGEYVIAFNSPANSATG